MAALLPALRDYLVESNIARLPQEAGTGDPDTWLPPLWLAPQLGCPAPGEAPSKTANPVEIGQRMVLSASISGGFPGGPYVSAWRRKPTVEFRFRGLWSPEIEDKEQEIALALGDRRDWVMAGLYVIECQQWRELTPLSYDEQSFNFLSAFSFELLRQ